MSSKATSYMGWFSVINMFTNIIAICQILFGLIFILIILCNRTHRTISNCLAANTATSITLYAISVFLISIHMRQCDNYPEQCIEDNTCLFRNYINDVAATAAIYSLAVESIHRFLTARFLHNVRLQMYQLRIILCIIQWVIAFLFPSYYIYFNPQLQYDSVSYVCVIMENSNAFITLYILFIGFLFPAIITISVYIKILLYVRQLRKSAIMTGLPSALSSKHELRMAKRILLLLSIFGLGSLPGIICQTIKSPAVYQYRIYYLGVILASFCCLCCLFAFTLVIRQQLIRWKKIIINSIQCPNKNRIAPQESRY